MKKKQIDIEYADHRWPAAFQKHRPKIVQEDDIFCVQLRDADGEPITGQGKTIEDAVRDWAVRFEETHTDNF